VEPNLHKTARKQVNYYQTLSIGNHIILVPLDIPLAIHCFRQAILDGEINRKELDRCVFKILATNLALFNNSERMEPSIDEINSKKTQDLRTELWDQIITLVSFDKRSGSKKGCCSNR